MKLDEHREIVHELDGIRANLTVCLRKLSEDRRANNPYAQLGWEVMEKLNGLISDIHDRSDSRKEDK